MSAPIMSRFDLFFILIDECNEVIIILMLHVHFMYCFKVTDYAIARRIVDLHSRKQESVDRVYTLVCHMIIV